MSPSSLVRPSKLLHLALRTDAIGCAIFAVAILFLLTAPNGIVEQLAVPFGVLVGAGLVALIGVPLLWSMLRREYLSRSSVWVLMACNFLWAIASIVAVAAGWIKPTVLGEVIIIGQGIATGVIAEMEFLGLRRSSDRQSATRDNLQVVGN